MSKLIYDKPVELDGKVIVSTEVLTHFRCYQCGKYPTASDLQAESDRIVFCIYCGQANELPGLLLRHRLEGFSNDDLINEIERRGDERVSYH